MEGEALLGADAGASSPSGSPGARRAAVFVTACVGVLATLALGLSSDGLGAFGGVTSPATMWRALGAASPRAATRPGPAGDGAGGSYPQFILRLVGFTLPLVLIGRAAYVYRRRREEALLRRVNEAFAIARSDEERAFAAALEMEEARARREAARDDEERRAGENRIGGEEERRRI